MKNIATLHILTLVKYKQSEEMISKESYTKGVVTEIIMDFPDLVETKME